MDPDYKAAYNILMDYWDCIPEEEKREVSERLDAVLSPLGGSNNATIARALKRLNFKEVKS
jgi:hypothetical protein|tara:strand:+ start:340 stop:522 length:183 start_codon:yes stop_codon:yes gene_type:complete